MAKLKEKSMWFCTECGAGSSKWEGKCPSCGAWNTMVEERVTAPASGSGKASARRELAPANPPPPA